MKTFLFKISTLVFFFVKAVSTANKTHEDFYRFAQEAYDELTKSFSLTMSLTILDHHHVQTMWYNEYIQVRNESTTYSGLYDPYLRLVTVMERGVYFENFDKTWRHLDPRASENILMAKLFELPNSNPITAAHIQRNNSVVSIAYKNLSVEVFDMKSVERTQKGEFKYKSLIIDSR